MADATETAAHTASTTSAVLDTPENQQAAPTTAGSTEMSAQEREALIARKIQADLIRKQTLRNRWSNIAAITLGAVTTAFTAIALNRRSKISAMKSDVGDVIADRLGADTGDGLYRNGRSETHEAAIKVVDALQTGSLTVGTETVPAKKVFKRQTLDAPAAFVQAATDAKGYLPSDAPAELKDKRAKAFNGEAAKARREEFFDGSKGVIATPAKGLVAGLLATAKGAWNVAFDWDHKKRPGALQTTMEAKRDSAANRLVNAVATETYDNRNRLQFKETPKLDTAKNLANVGLAFAPGALVTFGAQKLFSQFNQKAAMRDEMNAANDYAAAVGVKPRGSFSEEAISRADSSPTLRY